MSKRGGANEIDKLIFIFIFFNTKYFLFQILVALAITSTLALPVIEPKPFTFILNDDGTYKYGYTIDKGHFENAVKEESGAVAGEFGYTNDEGDEIHLTYTAGVEGFVPEGLHLPQEVEPIDVPAVVDNELPVVLKSDPVEEVIEVIEIVEPEVIAVEPVVYEAAVINNNLNGDGSYSFSYSSSFSSRDEQADTSNSVKGKFTFVSDDGETKEVKYIAGAETGYVPESDLLPVAPEVPAVPDVPAVPEIPAVPVEKTALVAPEETEIPAEPMPAEPVPAEPVPAEKSALEPVPVPAEKPASEPLYSFSYTNTDSGRDEESDLLLNIKGKYSFIADDGVERSVAYKAGAETGFVAEGEHLPVEPAVPEA